MTDKKNKKTKNTQEEIEAALAAATGASIGKSPVPNAKVEEKLCKTDDGKCESEPEVQPEEEVGEKPSDGNPIAMSVEDFGRKCFNLDIDSKMCHYQSSKTKDKSIDEFLRGINKKIYDETRNGGYSTNVQFRVAPNDYVNVNHIIDWYRARGFRVLNYNMGTAPYGQNAGMMEHNFTISWVEA